MRKRPDSVKSLLRKMYSLASHPGSSERLGACLMFDQIYRLLREEEALVDMFMMEILVCFIESLSIAHTDDRNSGINGQSD